LLQAVLEDYTGDAEVAKTADQDSSDNEKPMIGVMIGTLSPNLSLMADRTLPQGAYVSSVLENSPAEEAGMLAGDIVVEANGEIIANSTALQRVIQQAQRGDIIKLKVYRAENLSDILNNKADRSTLGEGKYVELEVTPKFPEHSM
jgi:S1-C subfamily serine protease